MIQIVCLLSRLGKRGKRTRDQRVVLPIFGVTLERNRLGVSKMENKMVYYIPATRQV